MGCCISSPHQAHVYRDPGDLDEEVVPLRYFGTFRAGSNLLPDDIAGLPSAVIQKHLAQNEDQILYEAEMDHGWAFRCLRPLLLLIFLPTYFAIFLAIVATQGISKVFIYCSCDQICCWVRKEYSTRRFFRVYPNRIVINNPAVRFPFGFFGCGSWTGDDVLTHNFDRGAFGFQPVRCCLVDFLCCLWPIYGGTVARHRCPCNGGPWNRCFTDCGGWWCDEWLCTLSFCTYRYSGLADPDEVAFASSIALQAYCEGRAITKDDMQKCIQFWHDNINEIHDPEGRKRPVCCEPVCVPNLRCTRCYNCFTHPKRNIPYAEDSITVETQEMYDNYETDRVAQMERFEKRSVVYGATCCRAFGCRRVFGRKGFFFCTDGCNNCDRKAGDPAPPFQEHDFDDDWNASSVLMTVLGPPPANVVIKRWRFDVERGENVLETYPKEEVEFDESNNPQSQEESPDKEAEGDEPETVPNEVAKEGEEEGSEEAARIKDE